jgi:hypothetical protein
LIGRLSGLVYLCERRAAGKDWNTGLLRLKSCPELRIQAELPESPAYFMVCIFPVQGKGEEVS